MYKRKTYNNSFLRFFLHTTSDLGGAGIVMGNGGVVPDAGAPRGDSWRR